MSRDFYDDDLEMINTDDDDEDEEAAEEELKELIREKAEERKAFMIEILKCSVWILFVFIMTLLIVKFVGQRTVVQGESMMPTLHNADNLIVDKISYRFNDPERFDIIVFPFAYEKNTYYIKRIIGLPGEKVRIDEFGNIYINNEILNEKYGAEVILDPGMAYGELELGKDEYFVLGDNRNHSSDSRTIAVGLIKRDDIIGRAWLRLYPGFGFLKDHD